MSNRKILLAQKSKMLASNKCQMIRHARSRRIILSLLLYWLLGCCSPGAAGAADVLCGQSRIMAEAAADTTMTQSQNESVAPPVKAEAAILMDARTGLVLYEKNAAISKPPASLTKIMTCILALENGDLRNTVTVSKQAAMIKTGSDVGLQEGDQLTLHDLLEACLLWSGNDAALAVGEYIGGTRDNFIAMMNSKAALLGMTATNFANTNGYSAPDHYTSACDLALLTRYALQNPVFAEMVQTKQATINWLNRKHSMELSNTNHLLNDYQGCIGVKTGTAITAGKCLTAAAARNEDTLIAVVLNCSNRFAEAAALLDYGFAALDDRLLVKAGESFGSVAVAGNKKDAVSKRIAVIAAGDLAVRLSAQQLELIEKKVCWLPDLKAPLQTGDKVGELIIKEAGQELGRVDLLAAEDCRRDWFFGN